MNQETETFLLSQGFERIEGLVGREKNERWFSGKTCLKMYLLLPADAVIKDVIEAIFYAGYHTHARMMKDKWQSFQELFTRAIPLPADLPEHQPPL